MRLLPLLLSLHLFLMEIRSQTFPYVTFMGQTLANHSYVDLSQVEMDYHSGLHCHTDLTTCCSTAQGSHRGDWFFPNGNRLRYFENDGDIYEHHGSERVDLNRRNNANSPSGIYHCDIPTNAVHDDNDTSVRETVYVGLYYRGGVDNIYIVFAFSLVF